MWAATIRASCENYKKKVGGVNVVGCTVLDNPTGCVLNKLLQSYVNHRELCVQHLV